MSFLKEGFVGDVTALELCSVACGQRSLLLAGMGPMLYVYDPQKSEQPCLLRRRVLEGARIHGFATAARGSSSRLLILVYGDRFTKLLRMDVTEAEEISLAVATSTYSCPCWILDAVFAPSSALILLSLSNNTIQVLSFSLDWEEERNVGDLVERGTIANETRTLLFSAAIFCRPIGSETDLNEGSCDRSPPRQSEQEEEEPLEENHSKSNRDWIHVASGTAFGEIMTWQFVLDGEAPDDVVVVSPAFRLQGHAGAVLRLCWIEDGSALLSVSEDRTLAAWDIPLEATSGTCTGPVEPRFRRFGHQARVWDVCCWDSRIVTCSEDCSFRVWTLQDGEMINTTQAHTGRGIWRCQIASDGSLVTGGADASIQVWPGVLKRKKTSSPENCLGKSKDKNANLQRSMMEGRLELPPLATSTDFVRCLCISRCCLDVGYAFTNKGVALRWTIDTDSVPDAQTEKSACPSHKCGSVTELYWNIDHLGSCLSCACHVVQLDSEARFDLIAVGGSGGILDLLFVAPDGAVVNTLSVQAFEDRPILSVHIQGSPDPGCCFVSAADSVSCFNCMRICIDLGDNLCRTDPLSATAESTDGDDPIPNSSRLRFAESFLLESPFRSRLICLKHCFLEHEHLVVAGDVKGSIMQWKVARHESDGTFAPSLTSSFRQVHGKQAVGMIYCLPSALAVYTAAKNFAVQQFNIVNSALQTAGESRLRDISTVEYMKMEEGVHLVAGFCQSYFYLIDLFHDRRIVQVDTGGRNRLHDLCVAVGEETCDVAFASLSNSMLQFVRGSFERSPQRNGFNRCLHFMSHGREINSVRLLPVDGRPSHQLSHLFTASEDGRVNLLWHPMARSKHRPIPTTRMGSSLSFPDEDSGGYFESCREIGVSPIGASMKTLSLVWCEHMGGWILVGAGSKQVIMTWLIKETDAQLECSLLSSQTLSAGGLRPRSNRRPSALDAELRYLASELIADGDRLLLFLASSDARLYVFCFDPAHRRWYRSAELRGISFPVLSLASIQCHHASNAPLHTQPCSERSACSVTVAAGSTNGQVAIWDISHNAQVALTTSAVHRSLMELQAIASFEELHQSGINCLSLKQLCRKYSRMDYHSCASRLASRSPEDGNKTDRLLLVTGGDDQSIVVASVLLCPAGSCDSPLSEGRRGGLEVLQRLSAHSSAVRGLWFDGAFVFSVGLDQRVVCWRLSQNDIVEEVSCGVCEIPEPGSLDAQRIDRNRFIIVVVGRGSQLLQIHVKEDS